MDKKEILTKLFWDRNVDIAYMLSLLEGKPERIPGDRIDLYRRFLTSHDWYTLLNLFSVATLKDEILDEKVIRRLFPKELLNSVKCISPVNVEMLNDDIALLHNDIFLGKKNSLCSE